MSPSGQAKTSEQKPARGGPRLLFGVVASAVVGLALGVLWHWWAGAVVLAGVGGWLFARISSGRTLARLELHARRMTREGATRRTPRSGRPAEDALAEALDGAAKDFARRGAELAALRRERDALLRSMHGGVLALDADQRIVRVDARCEVMLGLRDAESRGRLVQEVARHPELNRFIEEAIERGGAHESELSLRCEPARRVRAHSAAVYPEHGAEGDSAIAGLLIVLIDVTELRRLESLRTDFAANVSHELRTPITNIKGYVETLLDTGLEDREQALGFLNTVSRNADRLGTIIEDMLMLTRLERAEGDEPLETAWTALGDLIGQVAAELEGQLQSKAMRLVVEAPDSLGAPMNEALVRLALVNLVGNAIRYSPPERRVWIHGSIAERPGDGRWLAIAVRDEGPGIEEEHLERLFERFYRVEKARSREAGGTGLGLAIAKHIAILHGGRVEVSSKVGQGSVFTLWLPAGTAPAGDEDIVSL